MGDGNETLKNNLRVGASKFAPLEEADGKMAGAFLLTRIRIFLHYTQLGRAPFKFYYLIYLFVHTLLFSSLVEVINLFPDIVHYSQL
jgi:hypothetical protein